MQRSNVLRVNAVEEQADYREAVAEILRNVQSDHKVTLAEIAEKIDVSLGTISNAANKKADLSSIFLNRIGRMFGPDALDPYARLAGGRIVAVQANGDADVLPILTMVSHRVAAARCPTSPGGTAEILAEQLGYLPDLRRLHRELGALICRIEDRRDAA